MLIKYHYLSKDLRMNLIEIWFDPVLAVKPEGMNTINFHALDVL